MSIRIKVATTAQELMDVYHLRHQVYVEGEGYFKDLAGHGDTIIDPFDTIPYVANVIAYSGDTPVGTIRVNRDSEILLPSDEVFDFGPYRERINKERQQNNQPSCMVFSAGMLAIAKPWRNRRDVFRALFKMGCDVGYSWGATLSGNNSVITQRSTQSIVVANLVAIMPTYMALKDYLITYISKLLLRTTTNSRIHDSPWDMSLNKR